MGEWKMTALGEVADVIMGLSPKGDTYNQKKDGIPLLNGPTEFGPYHPHAILYTTDPARFAEPGDLLFCVRGSTTGRMNWADRQYAIGRGIAAIRAKTNGKDTFFAYCCICDSMKRLLSFTSGSVFPNLSTGDINAFEIPWPEESVRTCIAHILGTLDDKIELNRRMNRTLEKMAAALFKSWFIDFDPVHAKADGRDTGLPAEIADLFPDSFDDSDLGPIPKGWKVGSLGDVADSPRRGVNPSDVPPTTPYIGLEHMPRRCIALDAWGRALDVASGKSQFKQGEIMFGKLRPYFHKVGIAPMDGVCSTDIVVVKPKSQDWHGYVISLVSSKAFVDYTDSHSAGTKMPRTNWKDMSRYPLTLPPLSVAKAFQSHVADFHRRIMLNVRQDRRLAVLRDALLPKLMSGEIEVCDFVIIGKEVEA
jgi:type I restriction enzyme S subunit